MGKSHVSKKKRYNFPYTKVDGVLINNNPPTFPLRATNPTSEITPQLIVIAGKPKLLL